MLDNEILDYLIAGFSLSLGIGPNPLLLRLTSTLLFRLAKRYPAGVTKQELHNLLIQPLGTLRYIITVYLALNVLRYPLPPTAVEGLKPWPKALLLTYPAFKHYYHASLGNYSASELFAAGGAALGDLTATAGTHRLDSQFLPFVRDLLKILVVIIGRLLALRQVFGVNVTALVGGLGIGSLAVTCAAKENLENLLTSSTFFSTSRSA